MPSINRFPSTPPAPAENTVQDTDRRVGSPSSEASSRLPPLRAPSHPPAIHLAGRRRPAALALPSSEPAFPLTRLPVEMQQAVLPHLDAKSMADLALASKQMKNMVYDDPNALRRLRLMSAPPPAQPDPVYIQELRSGSEYLSEKDVHTLSQWALARRDGIARPWLLGPLLSGRARQDAERVAQAMDREPRRLFAEPLDPGHMMALMNALPPDELLWGPRQPRAGSQERGTMLGSILSGIGEPKNQDVYEPFLERFAQRSSYRINHLDFAELFLHPPHFAKDRMCEIVLHDPLGMNPFAELRHHNAARMFLVSKQLSAYSQNAVHERTRELIDASLFPTLDDTTRTSIGQIYSAENIAAQFPDAPEQRGKWHAFRESFGLQ